MSEVGDEKRDDESPDGGPDIDLASADNWPRRDFPIDSQRDKKKVRVVIKQSVLDEIHEHGQTRTDVEICGVMVGDGYQDDDGPFVYVEHIIRGQHSESQAAQVTFTGETWNHIHNELDREFSDKRILGWYHTHPGFGIFLSAMDLFIHENYFSSHEQLAFVFDPLSDDEGLFIWRDGKATRDRFQIECDVDVEHEPVDLPRREEFPATTAAASISNDEVLSRIERIEQRQQLMLVGLFVVALLAAFSPYVTGLLLTTPADSNKNSPTLNKPSDETFPPLRSYTPPSPKNKSPDDDPVDDDADDVDSNNNDQAKPPPVSDDDSPDSKNVPIENEKPTDGNKSDEPTPDKKDSETDENKEDLKKVDESDKTDEDAKTNDAIHRVDFEFSDADLAVQFVLTNDDAKWVTID